DVGAPASQGTIKGRLADVNDELAMLRREHGSVSKVGPRSLIVSGTLVAAGMGVFAFMFALRVAQLPPSRARAREVLQRHPGHRTRRGGWRARGAGGVGVARALCVMGRDQPIGRGIAGTGAL